MTLPPVASTTISTLLEVCQGPDCFGLGGGATILEIEELVQECHGVDADVVVKVVRGGCRNFCSMGPNVHFRGKHFSKVISVTKCQEIVKESTSDPVPIATKLLLRQASGQRWQALRLVARIQKSATKVSTQQIEAAKKELEKAFMNEERAVEKTTQKLKERAQRRRIRFLTSLECILQKNAELSDSEEEEDDDEEG